jgi:hypothetical protein
VTAVTRTLLLPSTCKEQIVNKRTTSDDYRDRGARRERLKREIAVLKAIGAPPRLFAARAERLVRQRLEPTRGESMASVTDASAVRSLAKHMRGKMQRELDQARRELLLQVKQLGPDSSAEQVGESLGLLNALRWFDPSGSQLDDAADSLNKLVHGDPPPTDKPGGAQRRNG